MGDSFQSVGRQANLYEAVAAQLREAILNGTFKSGQTLPNESVLAQQMAVSRPVVREALRYLQAQGLISISRGKMGGTVVETPDYLCLFDNISDLIRLRKLQVDHLMQVREFVEPEVFRLAALNASPEDLDRLENLVLSYESEKEPNRKRELNGEFHRQAGLACGNPIYHALMNRIMDFTLAFLEALKPEHVIIHNHRDHRLILEALKAKDPELACSLLRKHVAQINQQIKKFETAWLQLEVRAN